MGSETVKKRTAETSFFTHITSIYICLMLTVFVFYCGSGGYPGIMEAKFSLFCILCGGYVLVMGLAAVESIVVGNLKLPSPLAVLKASSWVQRLAVLYLILTWISAFLSPWFPESVLGVSRYEGALTISIYVLCFLLVSICGRVSKWMLWVLGATAGLFGVICLLQMMGHNPLGLFPQGVTYADRNVLYAGTFLGTTGNADLTAAFLCLTVPVLWVSLLRLNGRLRFLLLIPLVICLTVVVTMDVLAALLGVFLGGVLTVVVVAPVDRKKKVILWCAVLILGIACIVTLFFVDTGDGFLHEVHELLHGRSDPSFGSGRIQIWSEVLQRIPDNILFGTGPDTMLYAGLKTFSSVRDDLGAIIVAYTDAAHSEYLNILFHQGILALAAYLGMLILLAVKWIRNSARDPVTAVLGAGVCGYAVQALFGISMCMTAPLFWLTLGLLERQSSLKKTGGKKA